MLYLVTVKLPKGHSGPHNPFNKIQGQCPLTLITSDLPTCSDVTGEHHTVLYDHVPDSFLNVGYDFLQSRRGIVDAKVTRVEIVG